jgi:hypothetical protein
LSNVQKEVTSFVSNKEKTVGIIFLIFHNHQNYGFDNVLSAKEFEMVISFYTHMQKRIERRCHMVADRGHSAGPVQMLKGRWLNTGGWNLAPLQRRCQEILPWQLPFLLV